MMSLRCDSWQDAKPDLRLSPDEWGFVNHLRFVSMGCRAKPKAELFKACALLQVSQDATKEAYAEALMRCLNEALGKPARLHAPGTAELTFDEKWLVQLGSACAQQDKGSMTFLLNSRVSLKNRRLVAFLVAKSIECFSKI